MLLGWQTAATPGLGDRRWGFEPHFHFFQVYDTGWPTTQPLHASLCISEKSWKWLKEKKIFFFFTSCYVVSSQLMMLETLRYYGDTDITPKRHGCRYPSGVPGVFYAPQLCHSLRRSPLCPAGTIVSWSDQGHVLPWILSTRQLFRLFFLVPLDWVLSSRSLGSALRTVP